MWLCVPDMGSSTLVLVLKSNKYRFPKYFQMYLSTSLFKVNILVLKIYARLVLVVLNVLQSTCCDSLSYCNSGNIHTRNIFIQCYLYENKIL